MVSGYLTSTSFPWVDSWSTDPRVLRRHNNGLSADGESTLVSNHFRCIGKCSHLS